MIPQQDARKALIERIEHRFRKFYKDGTGPDIPDGVPLKCDLERIAESGDVTVGDLRQLAEALSESSASSEKPRMFPIQNGPDIPWSVIAPFEKQAQRQHSQTLERLAQRGGLSVCEVISILEGDGDYFHYWSNRSRKDDAANVLTLQGIVKELSAPSETQEERADERTLALAIIKRCADYVRGYMVPPPESRAMSQWPVDERHRAEWFRFQECARLLEAQPNAIIATAQPSPAQPAETPRIREALGLSENLMVIPAETPEESKDAK